MSAEEQSEKPPEVPGLALDPPEKPFTDDDVPKLPRGRGFKFSTADLVRIGFTAIMLVAVIVMARPCARATSSFVMSLDGSGSAKNKATLKPGTVDVPAAQPEPQYEKLRPGMTEAEIKAAIERSKARAAASGSGQ